MWLRIEMRHPGHIKLKLEEDIGRYHSKEFKGGNRGQ